MLEIQMLVVRSLDLIGVLFSLKSREEFACDMLLSPYSAL